MSEVSGSSYRAMSSEEIRLRNYRNQLEQRHEIAVRDILAHNADEIQKLTDNHTEQLNNLRHAYEVQISEEAEALEEKVHEIRLGNQGRVEMEKKTGDQEVEKMKSANKTKIEEYKKNADLQMETLHKQLQASSDALHEQSKKTAKREKGGSNP